MCVAGTLDLTSRRARQPASCLPPWPSFLSRLQAQESRYCRWIDHCTQHFVPELEFPACVDPESTNRL